MALPQSLNYNLPSSIADETRSYTVNVSPSGVTSVQGQVVALPYAAASGGNMGAFPQNIISFDLPSGQSPSVFMDCRETSLTFRLTWVTTTLAGGASTQANLIGSASSFFDSLSVYSNNVPLELIQNYNLLFNNMLNNSVNLTQRNGGCSVMMGCNDNIAKATGIDLYSGATAKTSYYTFTVPLLSILGLNNIDNKLFPVGSIGNLNLQLQTANLYPVSTYCTTIPTTMPGYSGLLDNFVLNMKYIDIGQSAYNLLRSASLNNKWLIKSRTFTASSATIPSGSSGQSNLMFQIRNSSVNSLFFQFSTNGSLALCPNGNYDAINPMCTSLQVSIGGGVKVPQRSLNPTQNPSGVYSMLASAWDASDALHDFGGVVTRSAYGASISTALSANVTDDSIVIPASALRPTTNGITPGTIIIANYPNMHYIGFDVSKITSNNLFTGVNTRSAPPFLECSLGAASATTLIAYGWAMSDVVLSVDLQTNQIQAFI
jgi:hypothetical protein